MTVLGTTGPAFTGQHNVVTLERTRTCWSARAPGCSRSAEARPDRPPDRSHGMGSRTRSGSSRMIVGGMKSAIDKGVANVRTALSGANQAAIAAIAQALNSPSSSLISDKGLGVISTGGGNVIGTGGLNVISDKGRGVISTGGGNLIGQAGGNLIGQAGGNVISTGGGNLVPVFGGKVIGTGRAQLGLA